MKFKPGDRVSHSRVKGHGTVHYVSGTDVYVFWDKWKSQLNASSIQSLDKNLRHLTKLELALK